MSVVLELFILVYSAAVGFVVAGIVTSFRQLWTQEPARFVMSGERWTVLLGSLLYFAVTGPMMIFRAVVVGRTGERRNLTWTIAGITVVGLWSICLGILVVGLVVRFVA